MTIARTRFLLILLALSSLGMAPAAQAQTLYVPQDDPPFLVLLPDAAKTADAAELVEEFLWLAQSCEGDCYDQGEPGGKSRSKNRYGTNLNEGTTRDLVKLLKEANDTCNEKIERRYRLDCLRIYYGWTADSLPDSGEYLPIKKAIRKAERKLAAIVSANVDRSEPVITPRKGHKPSAKKMPPLRPIKKSSETKAMAQAEAVVKEAEIVILRSGEDPTRRTAHYEEVSAALDSNLVILRSA